MLQHSNYLGFEMKKKKRKVRRFYEDARIPSRVERLEILVEGLYYRRYRRYRR